MCLPPARRFQDRLFCTKMGKNLPLLAALVPCLALQPVSATPVRAVGAESQYANVIAQIGGPYVSVQAIESSPAVDPHSFETSPAIARKLSQALLVVRNGLGYDSWAGKILKANPDPRRQTIVVQELLDLPRNTRNPHLWYKPQTMPQVASAVATALGKLEPAHQAYFQQQVRLFDTSLKPWYREIARFRTRYAHTPVAVTEPVADYLLTAMGCDIRTPWPLQAAIMNGTDPAPQDTSFQIRLLEKKAVRFMVYNRQVTSSLTRLFLEKARDSSVPVIGAYEIMPAGYSYQKWMLAETAALYRAAAQETAAAGTH